MVAKRETVRGIETREELELCLGHFRELWIERKAVQAEMEAAHKAIDEQYRPRLTGIEDELESERAEAEEWATRHHGEFNGAKTLDLTHGTLIFRTGQPTLKTIRGWTWARVLETLAVRGLIRYIREKQEPDKERLLADRDTLGAGEMRAIGLEVKQEERFYVEPKNVE